MPRFRRASTTARAFSGIPFFLTKGMTAVLIGASWG